MGEWWTYRLSDFLMFSPRTYARLVGGYNAELWPLQGVVAVAVIALLVLAARGDGRAAWPLRVAFAVAWAHVAYAFFWTRYAPIFTAAPHLAVAAAVQGLALLALCTRPSKSGAWLAAAAIALYPLAVVPITGREWMQADWFGWMPDPTALATIVFVASQKERPAWVRALLCVIPLAVLLFGWGTLVNLAEAGG